MNRITIKDIARLAGVSRGTVDRALNHRGNIDPEKKKVILNIAKQLGYEKNVIASTLAQNRVINVAVVLPFSVDGHFWSMPLIGIKRSERFIKHYGMTTSNFLFNIADKNDFSNKLTDAIKSKPDAILTAPVYFEESIKFLQIALQNDIPVFTINTEITHEDVICYIGQNSYQCGILAGRLLKTSVEGRQLLTITLGHESTNAKHISDKILGIKQFNKDNNIDCKVIDITIEDFRDENKLAFRVQKIAAKHKNIGGIFFTNSRAHYFLNCGETRMILNNKPLIVGFDLIPQNIKLLENDKIDYLINQDPIKQGYLGMINILNHFVYNKEVNLKQYLPVDIVVKENYEFYLQEMKNDLALAY